MSPLSVPSHYEFQSTLPRRERQDKFFTKPILTKISIHAPTKGATAILSNFTSYIFQFPLIFTNIFLLIFYLYHLPITFVHLFWCESSYTTVSTYHSHSNHIIRTSSAEIPLSTPTCSIFVLY